eukprot:11940948-Alexandrium_andersonii.AAC.1
MAFARVIVSRGRNEPPSLTGQPFVRAQPAARLPGRKLAIEREVRLRALRPRPGRRSGQPRKRSPSGV